MNKYSITLIITLTLLLNLFLIWINVQFKWWWIIPISILSSYVGNVLKATFQGFNIKNVERYIFDYDENRQIFEITIVEDFQGTVSIISGSFINNTNLSKEDFQMMLYKQAKKKEISSELIEGKQVIKHYKHLQETITIRFEQLIFKGKYYDYENR